MAWLKVFLFCHRKRQIFHIAFGFLKKISCLISFFFIVFSFPWYIFLYFKLRSPFVYLTGLHSFRPRGFSSCNFYWIFRPFFLALNSEADWTAPSRSRKCKEKLEAIIANLYSASRFHLPLMEHNIQKWRERERNNRSREERKRGIPPMSGLNEWLDMEYEKGKSKLRKR